MKSRIRQITEGTHLPNKERIRTFGEKESYKNLWILEVETIKQTVMKNKKYLRRRKNSRKQALKQKSN